MKAVIIQKYGTPDVLELKDIEKPVCKGNDVLLNNIQQTIRTKHT